LGYILDKRFWRNGYGSEICTSLIDYGFITLNLDKITARMFKQNAASIKLAEKCGMKLIQQEHAQKVKEYFEYEIYNSNKLK
jgi:[ribosomal protein S5]-alanine N-acetyltransferase